jgi:hypothetical protein
MANKMYILKHIPTSNKLFLGKNLLFSVSFLLKFQKKETIQAPYYTIATYLKKGPLSSVLL